MITVYYKGSAMTVQKEVADQLKLRNGYNIKTEDEFWNVLSQNACMGIAKCAIQKAAQSA